MTFKSLEELKEKLDTAIKNTLRQSQKEVYDVIQKAVTKFYYKDKFRPHSYDRTYQLRDYLNMNDINENILFDRHDYYAYVGYDYRDLNYDYDESEVLRWAMVGDRPHGNYAHGTAIWKNSNPTIEKKLPTYIKQQLKANGLPIK